MSTVRHVDRTVCPLESDELRGDFVVAFRKVRKREVAFGAGVRRAVDDTAGCYPNPWQGGAGLVV